MMYLKGAMALLNATGLVGKLIAAGVLVASMLTLYGIWHHKVYHSGYITALADIARQDSRAVGKATEFRNAFKACREQSKKWDQTTGACT